MSGFRGWWGSPSLGRALLRASKAGHSGLQHAGRRGTEEKLRPVGGPEKLGDFVMGESSSLSVRNGEEDEKLNSLVYHVLTSIL